MSIAAAGSAAGLPTGATNGGATIKVAPAPHLATNIQAAQYRLGDDGDGNNGVVNYSNGGMALKRDTASTLPEIQNPTGWFYLTVVNSGGAASNFSVSVTQAGTPISLPSSCVVPTTLAASGQPGDTFTCTFPRTFNATQSYALAATASATNAVTVSGQQQTVTVTTSAVSTCSAGQKVVPNLVDTLDPSADGTNKTIGDAKAAWAAAGFTGAFNSIPAGVTNSHHVLTQDRTAYTCRNTTSDVTVSAD